MECGHQRNLFISKLKLKPLSAECVYSRVCMEQVLNCSSTHCKNELGLEKVYLCLKKSSACGSFIRHRCAVHWRTAFYDVCDVAVCVASKTDGGKHLVQKLSCLADKGTSGLVFIFTWSFADDHYIRSFYSFTRNCICPCVCKNAVVAGVNFGFDCLKGDSACGLRSVRIFRGCFRCLGSVGFLFLL